MMDDINRSVELIYSALSYFLGNGEAVVDVADAGGSLRFVTSAGTIGAVSPTPRGWDIEVGSEVVYTIEGELYDIIRHDLNGDLIELYEQIRSIDEDSLKFRSRRYFEIVRGSAEKLILDMRLPLSGHAVVGGFEVFYTGKHRLKLCLN